MTNDEIKVMDSPTVEFHYIKSSCHRVVTCEGVIGAITPRGKIIASLYNERNSIPRAVTYEVMKDGQLGEPLEATGRGGITREIEVTLNLDRDSAEILRDWLGQQISSYDEMKD